MTLTLEIKDFARLAEIGERVHNECLHDCTNWIRSENGKEVYVIFLLSHTNVKVLITEEYADPETWKRFHELTVKDRLRTLARKVLSSPEQDPQQLRQLIASQLEEIANEPVT